MTRNCIAAILVALGLASSNTASAQILYNYSLPAYGGAVQNSAAATPYGLQSTTSFNSPFLGYMSQTSGNLNTLFSRGTYNEFYSPFTGLIGGERATMATPFGQLNYSSYYSPTTGLLQSARFGNATTVGNSTAGTTAAGNYSGYTGALSPQYYGFPNYGYNNGYGNGYHHHHH